jgi:hypothetical protein
MVPINYAVTSMRNATKLSLVIVSHKKPIVGMVSGVTSSTTTPTLNHLQSLTKFSPLIAPFFMKGKNVEEVSYFLRSLNEWKNFFLEN